MSLLQIFGPDSPDSVKDSPKLTNSEPVNTNPFLNDENDEEDNSSNTYEKPKPPPKKRNSDDSGTKLNDNKNVTPTKPLLPAKGYRAPPPPANKPVPAARPRVKAIIVSGKLPCKVENC